jgi:sugar phosphate isomerase/epimerase
MGSTEFRKKKNNISRKEADKIFLNFIQKIYPILKKKKIFLCIETIPKVYNENYLYSFTHLERLIKKINCSWVGINFDTSLFHFKNIDLLQFKKNINLIKNIQITEKNFDYFTNPSKKNMIFCNTIKKIQKIKQISMEIIVDKTNLRKLDKSMNNLMNLLN